MIVHLEISTEEYDHRRAVVTARDPNYGEASRAHTGRDSGAA